MHAGDGPGFLADPTADINLSFECDQLRNMDKFSKSDPFVVVYAKDAGGWRELGRTETVMDTLDPKFTQSFAVQYFFERTQYFRFDVYDQDAQTTDLERHDFIGTSGEIRLADVVSGRGSRKRVPLTAPRRRGPDGYITAIAEEMHGTSDSVQVRLSARKLANKDGWFGKSDPFVVISRQHNGKWVKCHETNVVMDNLNPSWASFTISSRNLCANDEHRPLLFEVVDWEASGSHQPIGHFTSTLFALQSREVTAGRLLHPKGKKKDVGTLVFDAIDVCKNHTFCDFLAGGCEIGLMICIDFTASNGDPRKPGTLHYSQPGQPPNDYEQAIDAVGNIVIAYDSDGLVPSYGFGARFPNGEVSHCFALTGQPDANCNGIVEVQHFYKQALVCSVYGLSHYFARVWLARDTYTPSHQRVHWLQANLQLYGPTNFAEFVNKTADVVRAANISQQEQQYFVLLVLTDGVITDMEDTISAIVAASELPLSIIIVGVGNADFSSMDRLDADDEPLRCRRTGRVMKRDIVQFVAYQKFKKLGPERLAMEVLEEVPAQLTGFFKSACIIPNEPPPPEQIQQHSQSSYAAGEAGSADNMSAVAAAMEASAPPPPPYAASGAGYSSSGGPPPAYTGPGGSTSTVAGSTMIVTVPAGSMAGSMIQVQTGGGLVQVQVPAGVTPGQQIQIQL